MQNIGQANQMQARNLLIETLGLAVGALAAVIHSQSLSIRALEKRQTGEAGRTAVVSLDLQGKCAKQAESVFREGGWDKKQFTDYSDHYSPRLGKCFMLISATDIARKNGAITDSRILSDAFEGRQVGTYVWFNPGNKKFWEVTPTECTVTLPTGEEKVCHSSEDFGELAKVHLQ